LRRESDFRNSQRLSYVFQLKDIADQYATQSGQASGLPVRVRAAPEGGLFKSSVANGGEPITEAALERLVTRS
jgi:hypothetical protein